MAPVNTTALRLIHVVKSTFLSNKIVVQNLRTIENSFLKQYVRAYSKEFETQPANSFGVPQEIRKKTVQIQKVLLLSEEGKHWIKRNIYIISSINFLQIRKFLFITISKDDSPKKLLLYLLKIF